MSTLLQEQPSGTFTVTFPKESPGPWWHLNCVSESRLGILCPSWEDGYETKNNKEKKEKNNEMPITFSWLRSPMGNKIFWTNTCVLMFAVCWCLMSTPESLFSEDHLAQFYRLRNLLASQLKGPKKTLGFNPTHVSHSVYFMPCLRPGRYTKPPLLVSIY